MDGAINIHVQHVRNNQKEYYWAAMIEDQFDAYGDTAREALGNFMLELKRCYGNEPLPIIQNITVNEEIADYDKARNAS